MKVYVFRRLEFQFINIEYLCKIFNTRRDASKFMREMRKKRKFGYFIKDENLD